MKTPLVSLLLLSLAGNAVLAFFALRTVPAQIPPAVAAPAVVSVKGASAAAPATTAIPALPQVAPVNWQTLKPDANLRTLVANLRALGFPPSVVRAVANQMITDQLGVGTVEQIPFWRRGAHNPEFVAAIQQATNQRREMLVDLLGADARPSAVMDPIVREQRYGQLSDEKVDLLESIGRDYNDLRTKLYAGSKPGDMPGILSAQVAAEQEQHAELASILTPEELVQHEMRNSSSANRLMSYLKSVDVNEAEYTALFRAQQAFDSADPMRAGVTTTDAVVRRLAAQDQLNEQARAVLTDDRFYEYLKGSDLQYARTVQFTANYPDITPAMTYDLTRIERENQVAISSLSQWSGAEHTARRAAMRQSYQNKVNALLGPEIGTAYAQRNQNGGIRR